MSLPDSNTPILFFDGVCNLCNSTVLFIVKHDRNKILRFSSLQSTHGRELLANIKQREGVVPDSLLLLYKGKVYTKAAAALHTAAFMGGGWLLLSIFRLVPSVISNLVYDFVAKNRYKWFGKRDECMIPSQELESRFIK